MLSSVSRLPADRRGATALEYGIIAAVIVLTLGLAVAPLGDQGRISGPATAVFGAALFTGQPQSSSDAPNPNYVLAPGDRVSVRVWGAVESELVGVIDPAGNLFLPNVGPVRVAGVRVGDLQAVIEAEIRRVYTAQVQVYATALSTQRIGVFVTGFVRQPGRFAGAASDSILDFLVRAGGVDPSRGSHREITLRRGNQAVATVDLYRFLLDGSLPQLRLQEGDTLVVGREGRKHDHIRFEPTDVERAELEAFAVACAGGPAYPLTLDEAVHSAAMFEAVAKGARTPGWIAVP